MSFVWSCRVVDWASDLQSCSILTFLFGNRIPLVLLSGQDTNRLNKWESKKIIGLLGAWMASTGYNLRVSRYTATTKQSKLALWILQLVNCRRVLAQAGVCKSGKFLAPTHEHRSEIHYIVFLNDLFYTYRRLWQRRPPCLKPIHCSLSCMCNLSHW